MNWKERAAVFLTEKGGGLVPPKLTKGALVGLGGTGEGTFQDVKNTHKLPETCRAIDPFRRDLPCAPERITPVPGPSWRTGQWQAYAARGDTAAERRSRLFTTPKQYRRQVLSHVRTMFAIQEKFRGRGNERTE